MLPRPRSNRSTPPEAMGEEGSGGEREGGGGEGRRESALWASIPAAPRGARRPATRLTCGVPCATRRAPHARLPARAAVETVFAEYQPRHLDYGQPHPDAVVETTSLSFAELPAITMHSHLPKSIQKPKTDDNEFGGALSRLQIETVVYAGMRHATTLPNGTKAGFFLGDGVGLGKGRQLAGIILDNWNQGRKRHLWVSVSADLMQDAIRDLRDIGAGHIEVLNIVKTIGGTKLDAGRNGFKEGVVFSTYSGLVSKGQKGSRERQIIQWLGGGDAEGCMLFDVRPTTA